MESLTGKTVKTTKTYQQNDGLEFVMWINGTWNISKQKNLHVKYMWSKYESYQSNKIRENWLEVIVCSDKSNDRKCS